MFVFINELSLLLLQVNPALFTHQMVSSVVVLGMHFVYHHILRAEQGL